MRSFSEICSFIQTAAEFPPEFPLVLNRKDGDEFENPQVTLHAVLLHCEGRPHPFTLRPSTEVLREACV